MSMMEEWMCVYAASRLLSCVLLSRLSRCMQAKAGPDLSRAWIASRDAGQVVWMAVAAG